MSFCSPYLSTLQENVFREETQRILSNRPAGVAQALLQAFQQGTRLFLVLFGGRALGRGEEYPHPWPLIIPEGGSRWERRVIQQQGRVYFCLKLAMRANHLVQRPGLDFFEQVGALGGVHDEPDGGLEGLSAARAGQGEGLSERSGHGGLLSVGQTVNE
jgi:hypothetical protein